MTELTASGMRVLIVSENVPPQVNGMARRVGHYIDYLRKRGADVTVLEPECQGEVWGFPNPWNFAARMMVVRPARFVSLLASEFDVVHVVMPLNLSGLWLLAGFKLLRGTSGMTAPALIVSWHCNLEAWNEMLFPTWANSTMEKICRCLFLPIAQLSDRLLVPTPSTEVRPAARPPPRLR